MYERAEYIYRYLGSVWKVLPRKERLLFSELWRGYQQVLGDVLQRGFEHDLATSVRDIPAFVTHRWNKYTFDSNNKSDSPAIFNSKVDLAEGVDLSINYLLVIEESGVSYTVDCRGTTPQRTTIFEIVNKINGAVGYTLAQPIYSNTIIQFTTQSVGATASLRFLDSTPNNAALEILGIKVSDLPYDANEFPWRYALPTEHRIWKIPTMQNAIREENVSLYLQEGVDYTVTPEKWVHFKAQPPSVLWARNTKVNAQLPAYNFGWLIDYIDTSRDPEDYVLILQGLWFAYWMGPRPEFIKRALYLLFGLPVARAAGVVTDIQPPTGQYDSGTITVVETESEEEVEYPIPAGLETAVHVGETIEKFQPMCTGIDIWDKTNRPGFVETEIGYGNLGRFLTQDATWGRGDTDEAKAMRLLEEHTFLPQINVFSFIRQDISIGQVKFFLNAIKPLHKTYHLQMIIAAPDEPLDIREHMSWRYDVNLDPHLDMNLYIKQTAETRERYENGVEDLSLHLDPEGIQFGDSCTVIGWDWAGPRADWSRAAP